MRARGVEITTPVVNGGQSGRQRTAVPFTTAIGPGNWTWKSSQQTFLQRGNGLNAFYGPQPPSGASVPQAASPYQYSFAVFPDQEYTLVQVMLSIRAQPAGAGRVAGQRVVWLAFTHGAARLKVAVDVATDQIIAVQGLVGLIGNNPPAWIDDRVTSYTVAKGAAGAGVGAGTGTGTGARAGLGAAAGTRVGDGAGTSAGAASRPASQGRPVAPTYGGERTGLRVFSSFRAAQRAAPFSVLAPTMQPADLLWSLGLASGQLQAVIVTPTGEATVSEAVGYPSGSPWAFSPGGPGMAITGASAGAGSGAYGRFGETGVVISTYENGSIGGDSTPSLQAWIHRFPALEAPVDWQAYAYTMPFYPGAAGGGKGSMAQVGSSVYWYEPANPATLSRGRAVLYVTGHARSWSFTAAPGSFAPNIRLVTDGFVFTAPSGKYRVSWGADTAARQ